MRQAEDGSKWDTRLNPMQWKSTTSAAVSTTQELDTYTAVLDEVVHVASQTDTEEGKETGCSEEPRCAFGPRRCRRVCEKLGVSERCEGER